MLYASMARVYGVGVLEKGEGHGLPHVSHSHTWFRTRVCVCEDWKPADWVARDRGDATWNCDWEETVRSR